MTSPLIVVAILCPTLFSTSSPRFVRRCCGYAAHFHIQLRSCRTIQTVLFSLKVSSKLCPGFFQPQLSEARCEIALKSAYSCRARAQEKASSTSWRLVTFSNKPGQTSHDGALFTVCDDFDPGGVYHPLSPTLVHHRPSVPVRLAAIAVASCIVKSL